jgi:signal peptidase II
MRKKNVLSLFLVILGIDQVTKIFSRMYLSEVQPIWIIENHLKFLLAFNPGAFLSLGSNWSGTSRTLVFIVFVIGFLFFLWKLIKDPNNSDLQNNCYTLILSGGIGNLIDRIIFGQVTDFLWVGIGPLQTGIFNVADMAILFGVIFLLLEDLVFKRRSLSKQKTNQS